MTRAGSEGNWISVGEKEYFVRRWDAADPWASCVIVHGLGEHGGRYERLAGALRAKGLSVTAFDGQGHGRDARPRGCIDSYESLLDDVTNILRWNRDLTPTKPAVLLGHSMGGNLVLNHAMRIGQLEQLYQCVISSSPMIRAQRAPGPVGEWLARVWMRLWPNYQLRSKVYPERLMSDPAEQEAWRQDELFHTRLSLRLGAALIDSGRWALANAGRLATPLLLSHGEDDALTMPEASIEFSALAGATCELKIWPGYLHDPFRCLGKEEVIEHFVQFVRAVAERGKIS